MRIVLVGAGHTHMLLLNSLKKRPTPGIQWIFVNPSRFFFYSGAFTAVLSGEQPLTFAEVPLEPFLKKTPVEKSHIQFLHDRVVGFDPDAMVVNLEHSGPLAYDFMSFNIGGESARTDLFSIKPLPRLESRLANGKFRRLAIVGGGPTGVEVTLCLAHRFRDCEIHLFERTSSLLEKAPASTADRALELLKERKVQVWFGRDDRELEADLKLAATGHQAPTWIVESDLLVRNNELQTNSFLQTSRPEIFACGEGTQNPDRPWVPNGITAVRQAPILLENLLAAARGLEPQVEFVPQESYLVLMNCGDGTALGYKGDWDLGHHAGNRWLKNWIDRRFLEQFR